MRIALDYDGTYSEDPVFWDLVVILARQFKHEVRLVTMRRPDEAISLPGTEVVYTSRQAKVPYCKERGIEVDVWIDDSPHWLLSNSA